MTLISFVHFQGGIPFSVKEKRYVISAGRSDARRVAWLRVGWYAPLKVDEAD